MALAATVCGGATVFPVNPCRDSFVALALALESIAVAGQLVGAQRAVVLYRSRMNPDLGRNFQAMDPLEWLARMSDHIPDPGQHRTMFYGEYANRVRGSGQTREIAAPAGEEPKPRQRCPPSWARPIPKVDEVDPLVCTRCGQRMSLIAFVTDQLAIRKILDQPGLSAPEAEKPPPPLREVLRVAEHGEGWLRNGKLYTSQGCPPLELVPG